MILTDGEENQSQQYSCEDVRQMVTYRRVNHGWQFLFLGPERRFRYALSIGIPKVNTAGFATTPEGLRLMLERLSKTMAAYRLGDRSSCSSSKAEILCRTLTRSIWFQNRLGIYQKGNSASITKKILRTP